MDSAEALKRFDSEYIPFPPFEAAVSSIEANIELYRQVGLVRHLLVLGESGTGKSSLCLWIAQKYKPFELHDRTVVPALVVSVPPEATIASVAEAMLETLCDPAPTKGSISEKTARVVKLAHGCRVEVCLFDEAQHLHDRGREKTHYKVGDWAKTLVDKIAVPSVWLGLPRLEQLLQINEQLRRRFSRRLRLSLGQSGATTIQEECLQLSLSLAACMPVGISPGEYSWPEMGMRLYYASDGRVAYLKQLLANALRRALDAGSALFGPPELEQAFTDEIWWEGVGPLNPFNPRFEFRRLDRGNEPFERGSYDDRLPRLRSRR